MGKRGERRGGEESREKGRVRSGLEGEKGRMKRERGGKSERKSERKSEKKSE